MAKEPAGLRRWRLAHRKHRRVKHKKVYSVARRRRYGRKRKGGRKSKAIPILLAIPAILPGIEAYNQAGLTKALPEQMVYRYTGYHKDVGFSADVLKRAAIPFVVGIIGHKIASKTGVNRQVKKFTMGYLQL